MQRFFEIKFGKKSEGAIKDSRERTADTLHNDLESVALATESTIQDTKERQLVTRSGLQRLRCCVCHLHHKQAMTAPSTVRKIIKKQVLQQMHHFEVDVIAGDANAAAYRYYKRQRLPRPVQLFSSCHVERNAT